MRILHCISKLKAGGAQTQLLLLTNNFNHKNYDVHILCWDDDSAIAINRNITIHLIKKQKGIKIIIFWFNLYRYIKNIKPDIIQLWLPEIITVPAAIFGTFLGIKVVSCERRVPTSSFGILWLRDRLKYISHVFSNKMIINFPIPDKNLKVFKYLFQNRKGTIIYNGIDLTHLLVGQKKENTDKAFRLVYVGRLATQKNVGLLIQAVKELIDQYAFSIKLEIYGVGEKEDELKRLVQSLNMQSIISFMGFRNNWHINAANANCFILPSNLEGMPNVLFEAASIGLPLLASDIPEIAVHFTNKKDALLFKVNDVASIRDAIKIAIAQPTLLNEINDNAQLTIQKYSIERMVKSYEALYNSLYTER